ncbi:MAG: hypothetical protein JWP65_328 [Ramlibacter sp.]|nr:hypothetical protein [Ramlibacter sp.]
MPGAMTQVSWSGVEWSGVEWRSGDAAFARLAVQHAAVTPGPPRSCNRVASTHPRPAAPGARSQARRLSWWAARPETRRARPLLEKMGQNTCHAWRCPSRSDRQDLHQHAPGPPHARQLRSVGAGRGRWAGSETAAGPHAPQCVQQLGAGEVQARAGRDRERARLQALRERIRHRADARGPGRAAERRRRARRRAAGRAASLYAAPAWPAAQCSAGVLQRGAPAAAAAGGTGSQVAARSVFAASTMLANAGRTSDHWRVLRPQSGFTHRRLAGMRSAAFCISATMCSCVGMFGEWMS